MRTGRMQGNPAEVDATHRTRGPCFVAVILDCIDDQALAFYRRWDFRTLPGHSYRLFLSWSQLQAMATGY